ncbi:hexose kinase [Nesterenkonia sp. AY15]|uniref:1-phosphofructokinase family hexose kinase n=1 Tax=unclassified Nesterenkonia TaxID=2629769 RepID=UPI001F4C86E2|nr:MULTISPECIES: hexose kinase [unclassified Nesterenkonia]MCH8562650.1 hexose kinase [Nesterenkonia sp. YGD6]MCH8570493.1 hexose kinase [Nesterenkonia sp. AY15]
MIVTFTPNPSLDKTLELDAPLRTGAVQRAIGHTAEPGGKGVNISRALTAAGTRSLAVLPGDPGDPVLLALQELGVEARALPLGAPLRTNTAITDPQGVTTKINEPGPAFDAALTGALLQLLLQASEGASWVALAGSLPPGVPVDFYAQAITALRRTFGEQAPKIALDTSGEPMAAALPAAPDLIKPNAEELLELHAAFTGSAATDPDTAQRLADELETDPARAVQLATELQHHGARAALVTLGAHGAVFIPNLKTAPSDGEPAALRAWGPAIVPRSTVGAGDASLAGFIAAAQSGASETDSLKHAMAMGRAAAELPGSIMPTPQHLSTSALSTEALSTEHLTLNPSTTTTVNVETS